MPTALQLRRGIATISTAASTDLRWIFAQVSTPVEARDGLRDVLPTLIDQYGAAAAAFAADWYDDLRLEAGARGRFTSIPADLGRTGADELARWGVAPLFAATPDWAAAQTLVDGGLQRRIANASRNTITGSSIKDPAARGWQRVGAGGCDFCQMLLDRGAVYSEETADFPAHDHCNCQAEPAF